MTRKITTTAILIAMGTVLSLITVYRAPFGGTVTAASMLPIILIGIFFGAKWGILGSVIYSVLQMITAGIAAPPVQDVLSYFEVIALDYVIAFGVLGLSGLFYDLFGKKSFSMPLAGGIVIFLRFLCHFVSGIIIWGIYAPAGQSPAVYSLLYNGSYMLFEFIITVAVIFLISKFISGKISEFR